MCSELVNSDFLRVLINYTKDNDPIIIENGYWAISNILCVDISYRDAICESISIPYTQNLQITQKIIWLLSNILKQEPFPSVNWYDLSLILCKSNIQYKELLNDILCLLSNILLNESYISSLFATGLIDVLFDLTQFNDQYYFSIFYSLTSGNDIEIQYLLDHGLLQIYFNYLLETSENAQFLILQALYNISIGSTTHVFHVIKSQLINKIIILIKACSGKNLRICIEILEAVSVNKAFSKELWECGVLSIFFECIEQGIYICECIHGIYQFINTNYIDKQAIAKVYDQLIIKEYDDNTRYMANSLLLIMNR